MSNKTKVMSILLDANNELTADDIKWIASHLPDDDNQIGSYTAKTKSVVDHSCTSVYNAFGITEKDLAGYAKVMAKAISSSDKVSEAVEKVLDDVRDDQNFFTSLLIKTMQEAISEAEKKISEIDPAIKKFINQLRKKFEEDESSDEE